MTLNKKELIKTAEELNEVLGLKPKLKVDVELSVLIPKIKKAIELIDWKEDEFSEDVENTINKITDQIIEEQEEKEKEKEEEQDEHEEKEEKKPAKKEKKEKKSKTKTKKAVVLEMIAVKGGATIEEIAESIVEQGIDPDLEKNKTVVKLWLSKMGHDTKKDAIKADPKFKAK